MKIQLANNTGNEETTVQEYKVDDSQKKENKEPYDVLIVGAGPSGYTAGIYSARYNLKTLIIGEEMGGQMDVDYDVENYPGFRKIRGRDLMAKIDEQTKDLGTEVVLDKVLRIEKVDETLFKVTTMFSIFYSHSIILALGTKRRKLNVKGEDKLIAKGVSYCATCDGAFFKGKDVAIVGGGNSAFASALVLLQHVRKLYLIHRRSEFRANPALVDEVRERDNIEFITPANVTEVIGETEVEKITTDNLDYPEIKVEGIFIEVGTIPAMTLAKEVGVEVDETGYINVTKTQETNIKGIFAAGDITTESNKTKQVIVAAGEGAIASEAAFHYIRGIKKKLEQK